MTKKDYELIAGTINWTYMGHRDWKRSLEQISNTFADVLQSNNPKFDRIKFLRACKVIE